MKKELTTYILIGVASVFVDYISYLGFVSFFSTSLAKTFSYIAGMVVGFVCNRYFTFKSTNRVHRDAFFFVIVYVGSLLLNVTINEAVLFLSPSSITIAFMTATGTSVVTNYLGQKFWVYRK